MREYTGKTINGHTWKYPSCSLWPPCFFSQASEIPLKPSRNLLCFLQLSRSPLQKKPNKSSPPVKISAAPSLMEKHPLKSTPPPAPTCSPRYLPHYHAAGSQKHSLLCSPQRFVAFFIFSGHMSHTHWLPEPIIWFFNSQWRGNTWPPEAAPPGKICCSNYLPKWGSTMIFWVRLCLHEPYSNGYLEFSKPNTKNYP